MLKMRCLFLGLLLTAAGLSTAAANAAPPPRCICKQAGAFCTADAQCCSGVCTGGLFTGTLCR